MSNDNISAENFKDLLAEPRPFIDVRAPVEFALGSLPGAVNLPILGNDERALIGTTYKEQGREVAIKLGYQLISGDVKTERVQAWTQFIQKNPHAVIYCFRGGLRSQIAQQWLKEVGIHRPLIVDGYKAARNFLMETVSSFAKQHDLWLISGATGSRKTKLIENVKQSCPAVDLEGLASHRGSAFGATEKEQPSQIDFENLLAVELLKIEPYMQNRKLLVEDESRLIGRNAIPAPFFEKMRSSPVIWVEEPIEARVENIFQDYILHSGRLKLELLASFKEAVKAISKKLGGLRSQEILSLINAAETEYTDSGRLEPNKLWIERLLVYYYDPLYLQSIDKRQVKVIFKGSRLDCEKYLINQKK